MTYVRTPRFDPIAPDDAVRRLVTAYLHAYGPASPADFAKWLATPRDWAERAFDGFEPTEHGFVAPGDTSWPSISDDTGEPAPTTGELKLLPYFDAYTIGAQPRDRIFAGADRALSHGQAGVFPVMIVGGEVRGIWHHRRSGRKITVTIEPFGQLTKAHQRGLDAELDRLAVITEARIDAKVGTVGVGAHK